MSVEMENRAGMSAPAAEGEAGESLSSALERRTTVGELWRAEGDRARCVACGHRCLLAAGRRGICRVRFNHEGQLRVPFGYVAGGLASDPVEKKPFFHVYPGSDALTYGMLGCDFHCPYCQNWVTSQALRDEASVSAVVDLTPEQIVAAARRSGARLVVSSYNEPLITAEWSVAVFQKAKAAGFDCAFVSNGNATPEALDYLRPWIMAYKIDLKGFKDQGYRKLGGTLEAVREGVRMVNQRKLWLEVVTLIVPGFNDSEEELRDIAQFLVSVNPAIPWHVTAFHPDYRMSELPATGARNLVRAAEIGAEAGLRFVYAGNAPGQVGPWENTYCPTCRQLLIERVGYLICDYKLTAEGKCPNCQGAIPGIWPTDGSVKIWAGDVLTGFRQRIPRRVRTS